MGSTNDVFSISEAISVIALPGELSGANSAFGALLADVGVACASFGRTSTSGIDIVLCF